MKREILKFGTNGCAPCKLLDRILDPLDNVTMVDCNEQPDLAAHYGVTQVPVLVYLEDGVEYERTVGLVPFSVIEEKLND